MRLLSLAGGLVVLLVCLSPPFTSWARRYEVAEALQFSLLAVAVPALVVCGAPWRMARLAAKQPPEDEDRMVPPSAVLPPADRLAQGRRRHPESLRSAGFAALFFTSAIVWRVPPTVDALAHHPWLLTVEAVTLVVTGMGLWLELVESPPLAPRLSRPHRVALAAVTMWTLWIVAYLVGLSHASWYHAYPHAPGVGLSLSADQQLSTGAIWLLSGCAFVPVVFWNLIRWLQAEEDPDDALHHLVRMERTRSGPVGPDRSLS